MDKDQITALTGLVGAISGLSGVIVSYLTFKHGRDKTKPKIKVEARRSLILLPTREATDDMLVIKVANYGEVNFTVVNVGIAIGRHTSGLAFTKPPGTVDTPYELKPENTCNFWTDYEGLRERIKRKTFRSKIKIRAYVSDYMGRTYVSEFHTYIIKETRFYKFRIKLLKWYQYLRKVIIP